MLEHVTPLDGGALLAFLAIWMGYNLLFDGRLRRPGSINAQMIAIRQTWMVRLLGRENRIGDATLIGHSIRSATFFASTTLLLLAGLLGVLGSAERIHGATTNLSVLLGDDPLALFELKVFVLVGIFVYAFFKFTWAIRQFNYFSAIIGSAPEAAAGPVDMPFARRMAVMLSHAFWQFNAGIRAYYFALATIGWFIHPLVFIAATVLIVLVLVRRQLYSATAQDIADHAESLGGGIGRDAD
jgi:uncharacterized membrane protein